MIFFLLILLLFIISIILKNDIPKSAKKILLFIMACAFVAIAGFRGISVGTDTKSYYISFINYDLPTIKNIGDFFFEEIGYSFIVFVFNKLNLNFTVFITAVAILSVSSIFLIVDRFSTNYFISLLMYLSMGYFYFSMAGIRQTIALSIYLIALYFLLKGKKITYILFVFLAMFFHKTVLITLPLCFLSNKKINIYEIILLIISSFVTFIFSGKIVEIAVNILWSKGERGYESEYGGISTLILLVLIFLLSIIIVCLNKKSKIMLNSKINFFIRMLMVSIPFQVLAIYQANSFRVAMYFHIISIILVPNIVNVFVEKEKNKYLKNILDIIICCFLLIQFFAFTYKTADIIPYVPFWK